MAGGSGWKRQYLHRYGEARCSRSAVPTAMLLSLPPSRLLVHGNFALACLNSQARSSWRWRGSQFLGRMQERLLAANGLANDADETYCEEVKYVGIFHSSVQGINAVEILAEEWYSHGCPCVNCMLKEGTRTYV